MEAVPAVRRAARAAVAAAVADPTAEAVTARAEAVPVDRTAALVSVVATLAPIRTINTAHLIVEILSLVAVMAPPQGKFFSCFVRYFLSSISGNESNIARLILSFLLQ